MKRWKIAALLLALLFVADIGHTGGPPSDFEGMTAKEIQYVMDRCAKMLAEGDFTPGQMSALMNKWNQGFEALYGSPHVEVPYRPQPAVVGPIESINTAVTVPFKVDPQFAMEPVAGPLPSWTQPMGMRPAPYHPEANVIPVENQGQMSQWIDKLGYNGQAARAGTPGSQIQVVNPWELNKQLLDSGYGSQAGQYEATPEGSLKGGKPSWGGGGGGVANSLAAMTWLLLPSSVTVTPTCRTMNDAGECEVPGQGELEFGPSIGAVAIAACIVALKEPAEVESTTEVEGPFKGQCKPGYSRKPPKWDCQADTTQTPTPTPSASPSPGYCGPRGCPDEHGCLSDEFFFYPGQQCMNKDPNKWPRDFVPGPGNRTSPTFSNEVSCFYYWIRDIPAPRGCRFTP
jgi:hypothetical protein